MVTTAAYRALATHLIHAPIYTDPPLGMVDHLHALEQACVWELQSATDPADCLDCVPQTDVCHRPVSFREVGTRELLGEGLDEVRVDVLIATLPEQLRGVGDEFLLPGR